MDEWTQSMCQVLITKQGFILTCAIKSTGAASLDFTKIFVWFNHHPVADRDDHKDGLLNQE